ncbi:E3 ubiquitin-protein ligase TRIM33-like [Mytilus edulis]|uniref:E3 ubiquitin-protein ligase TRIM33-like n=1 Tax=Mytilus edulis TaxID=6550 RepID=UPI0039F079EC
MTSKTPALSIEKLKRHFLECTICKEQYDVEEKHPRVLPCLHSFCYSCLGNLIKQTKNTCPICNSDFGTENITPDLFPKDNTRRDLLDFVHAADENTFLACDECDENEKSVARCKDCFKFLGENCLKAHKSMKTFAKHRVFTLRDVTFDVNSISDFRSAGICSNHDEVLKLYCAGKECQAPICHSCCLTSHMDDQNHVRRNIDEVYSEKKDNLLEKGIKLTNMSNELDQLSSKVVQTVEYLDENSKKVENEITAIFQIAIEMLQRRRNYLMEEVKGIKKDKEIVLQKQEEEICFLRQSIIDAYEFLNQSLASKNQAAFLILSNTIAERFDYLLKTDFNKVPNDDNLINFRKCNLGAYFQLIVNMLGCIASTTAYGPNTVVNIPCTVKRDAVFDLEIDFYDFTNSQIPEKIIATITLFDNKDEVITDCEEKLMIEDCDGKYKTTCTIADGTKSISRICIKVNGNAFHCIKLDTTVKDGVEDCTNGTETKVAEQDMDTGLSIQKKEYAVTEHKNEDTYPKYKVEEKLTEHAQSNSASKNGKGDILTGHVKGDTDSESGKTDTLSGEQTTLDLKIEEELSGPGEEKIGKMQINTEGQSMYCKENSHCVYYTWFNNR